MQLKCLLCFFSDELLLNINDSKNFLGEVLDLLYVSDVLSDTECRVVDTEDFTEEVVSIEDVKTLAKNNVTIAGVSDSLGVYPVSYYENKICPKFEWLSTEVKDGIFLLSSSIRGRKYVRDLSNRGYVYLFEDFETGKPTRYEGQLCDLALDTHSSCVRVFREYTYEESYGSTKFVDTAYTVRHECLNLVIVPDTGRIVSTHVEDKWGSSAIACSNSLHNWFKVATVDLLSHCRDNNISVVTCSSEEYFSKYFKPRNETSVWALAYYIEDYDIFLGDSPHAIEAWYFSDRIIRSHGRPYVTLGDYAVTPYPELVLLQTLLNKSRCFVDVDRQIDFRSADGCRVPVSIVQTGTDFSIKCFDIEAKRLINVSLLEITDKPHEDFRGVSVTDDWVYVSLLDGDIRISINSYKNLMGYVQTPEVQRLQTIKALLGDGDSMELHGNGKLISIKPDASDGITIPKLATDINKDCIEITAHTHTLVFPASITKCSTHCIKNGSRIDGVLNLELQNENPGVVKNLISSIDNNYGVSRNKINFKCASSEAFACLMAAFLSLPFRGGFDFKLNRDVSAVTKTIQIGGSGEDNRDIQAFLEKLSHITSFRFKDNVTSLELNQYIVEASIEDFDTYIREEGMIPKIAGIVMERSLKKFNFTSKFPRIGTQSRSSASSFMDYFMNKSERNVETAFCYTNYSSPMHIYRILRIFCGAMMWYVNPSELHGLLSLFKEVDARIEYIYDTLSAFICERIDNEESLMELVDAINEFAETQDKNNG